MLREVEVLELGVARTMSLADFVQDLVPNRRAVIPLRFLNKLLDHGTYAGGTFEPFVVAEDEYHPVVAALDARGWFLSKKPTPEWVQTASEWVLWNGICAEETIEALRAITPAYEAMMAEMNDVTLRRYREVQERFHTLLKRDDPVSPFLPG